LAFFAGFVIYLIRRGRDSHEELSDNDDLNEFQSTAVGTTLQDDDDDDQDIEHPDLIESNRLYESGGGSSDLHSEESGANAPHVYV
jgi:hypothetical protein